MLIFYVLLIYSTRGVHTAWESWILQYPTSIPDDQLSFRQQTFLQNLELIHAHNNDSRRNHSFQLALNPQAHLTQEEYLARLSNTKTPIFPKAVKPKVKFAVPRSWDWRTRKMVGPVSDDGGCSAPWATVPVDQASSCCAIQKKRAFLEGNAKQIQSCATPEGENCAAGDISLAHSQLKKYGIENGTSTHGECKRNPADVFCKVANIVPLPKGDEENIRVAVFLHGPVLAHIDASAPSFRFYSGGIYNERNCSQVNLNHPVLVVGYGSTEAKEDFWIVKNSWGPNWGIDGYFYMIRNGGNRCGIASLATSIVVSSLKM